MLTNRLADIKLIRRNLNYMKGNEMAKSKDVERAILALKEELKTTLDKVGELKRTINQLSVFQGESPPFTDIESSAIGGIISISPDQFFGKGLATAVKEYLRIRGNAATPQEILDVLTKGGFEFPKNWKNENMLKNLAISLSKNRTNFCPVPLKDGNAYGLWEFYPEKMKEREKKQTTEEKEPEDQIDETIEDETSEQPGEPNDNVPF